MKDFLKITVPVTLLMLVFAETVLCFFPVEDPYKIQKTERYRKKNAYIPSQFLPNQTYTLESREGLPDVDTVIIFSTNNYGFRGDELKEKKQGVFRIFLVGGSSTECILTDDKKAPHTLMKHRLNDMQAEVFNAGKAGDMTVDHLAMLTHRIVHLQPDLIVLYCGFNDLKRSHNYDYTLIDSVSFKHTNGGTFLTDLRFLLSDFQIMRRLHYLFKKKSTETIKWQSSIKEFANRTHQLPNTNKVPKINLPAYKTNLLSFIGVCSKQNIKLVLVTQASSWNSAIDPEISKLHWITSYGDYKSDEKTLDSLLEKYNNVTRELVDNPNVLVYDLANKLPKSKRYFYDDCHFNNNGVAFYADSLSAFIRDSFGKTKELVN